jgi:hypothetical protein
VINTLEFSPSQATDLIIARLTELGLLPQDRAGNAEGEKIAEYA